MSGRLRHYVCGSTSHDLGHLMRGAEKGAREFPSGVFLYDAADGRRVLFDTGYATGRWRTGWRGAVYRRLLPPRVSTEDDVAARLRADGVDPASVTHVVLSHLHPDHVGGVRRFPQAIFVVSEGMLRTLRSPRLRTGVLTGLLPPWFPDPHTVVLQEADYTPVEAGGATLRGHDLLGDGSYLILDLPGHADGHQGALVERSVILAGDAAWGSDLLDDADRLKRLPRAVQHEPREYAMTARVLAQTAAGGIRVVCSHDPLESKDLLI